MQCLKQVTVTSSQLFSNWVPLINRKFEQQKGEAADTRKYLICLTLYRAKSMNGNNAKVLLLSNAVNNRYTVGGLGERE